MPIVVWIPVGRLGVAPDDSLHLARYGYEVKSLILDGDSVAHTDEIAPNQYFRVFGDLVAVAKSKPTWASIAVDSAWADGSNGGVAVRVTADSIPPGTQLRLVAVITEDSVVTQGFLSAIWNRVARRVLPDWQGREVSLARGDTLFDTLRFSTAGLNPAKLRAALFIRNAAEWTIVQSLGVSRLSP